MGVKYQIVMLLSLMKMSIKSSLQYKVSFIFDLLTSVLMFFSEFFVVYLLICEVDEIRGWSADQLAVMYVITVLAGSIEVFFTYQMRNFSGKILSGKLDLDLVRPIHPLHRTAGDVSVSGLLNVVLFSGVILTYLTAAIPGLWTLRNVLLFALAVIGGALIFSSITIFSCAFSFWTYDSQFFYRLVKQGTRQMLWYPMNIYSKGIRFALTFVYPLAFVSYYPAALIFKKDTEYVPAAFGYCSVIIGLALVSLAVLVWEQGLKRYEGAG